MSEAYEEIVHGETILRRAPGARHERICAQLHRRLGAFVAALPAVRLLAPRSVVQLSPGTLVRPDLALLTTASGKAWLLAEIVEPGDHSTDTVTKKALYEDLRLPRLWMIDPRYDNVEVYHGTPYGLALKRTLAGRDVLTESALPGFEFVITEVFAAGANGASEGANN